MTIPTGLRIRGSSSRKADHAKHSFRFFFRSEYGKSQLEDKTGVLFDNECGAATKYDKLDLRTSQNISWANEKSDLDTFVTEVFSRDAQRDLGQPYTRSRYYNLFINGQYWGLYQTQERGDEHFGEAYLGGDSLQYDVIKAASSWSSATRGRGTPGATSGTSRSTRASPATTRTTTCASSAAIPTARATRPTRSCSTRKA